MNDGFPDHIAIVMSGSKRWALTKNKDKAYGYYIGSLVIEDIAKVAVGMGIDCLTFHSDFSDGDEGIGSEVEFLIDMLAEQFEVRSKLFLDYGIRFDIIGDIRALDSKKRETVEILMKRTKNNNRMRLVLSFDYSAKLDITEAVKKLAVDVKKGKIDLEDMNESGFEGYLCVYDLPDIDLLIKTGGKRVTDFLLWRLAYAEFVFFDKYWPEFSREDLIFAIGEFKRRKRRFGGL